MGLDDHILQGWGGEGDCNPGSPASKNWKKNYSNHFLALRFTTKMFLLWWDSTTTFVRAEPTFLPLVAALAVVLESLVHVYCFCDGTWILSSEKTLYFGTFGFWCWFFFFYKSNWTSKCTLQWLTFKCCASDLVSQATPFANVPSLHKSSIVKPRKTSNKCYRICR